jgi:hypothetical protein
MAINPPNSTLAAIQQKVRRLTRSPSEAQLTSDDLNNYINTFVVYDFPEHLRTFNLRRQFTFYTNPYQDVYPTDILSFAGATGAAINPLYNFQNVYLTVINDPVYIAGYQSLYAQDRSKFFGIYPLVNSIASIHKRGDGVTTSFTGVVNINGAILNNRLVQQTCILKNNVLFSSVDINGNGLSLVDNPILDAVTGNPTIWGQLYTPEQITPGRATPPPILLAAPYFTQPGFPSTNYINYVTGQYVITFPLAPAPGRLIDSQVVPSVTTLPQALLFYENKFTVRPVPDQPYRINFEVYKRPDALLAEDQTPELEEYWQYIAYGCAKKIFEDRMDLDSVQLILPEYRKQENLCNRRTIVQYTGQRTATIYTEQTGNTGYNGGWGSGGGLF